MKLTEVDQLEAEYSTAYDEKHSEEVVRVLGGIAKEKIASEFVEKFSFNHLLGDLSIDHHITDQTREAGLFRKKTIPYKQLTVIAKGKVYRKVIS